jgi:UDP-N-acetylglucosamine 2-epimerase (non-hydrolysing)
LPRVLLIFGTRPEAIKLAPVVRRLRQWPERFETRVAATAQHREMLDQVLDAFSIQPDYDLDLMRPGQSLFESASRILSALEGVLQQERPDCALVQGDTTTAFAGALAAFYLNIPVGHVEAGLRTGDSRQPFPEEMNRALVGRLASMHFAPTAQAAENLKREGVKPDDIFVTGNTGIDAVLEIRDSLEAAGATGCRIYGRPTLDRTKKLILVTAHRRESFGDGFENICRALARLAARGDAEIVYPVHPNPHVQDPVNRLLRGVAGIHLLDPLPYVPFVDLMRKAHVLLTDSGGIQEEGPSLGKPVLVMREKTERPEAVAAGTARLVGVSEERIVMETALLLDDRAEYERRSHIHNPYGDGHAAERIRRILDARLASHATKSGAASIA